ncbi:hypothetical protein C8A03DRAFT_47013 [Achaetomium macrosporum]|uniref:Uncharacterized protein n=1 Tax=Achaetomium macrosporum TaxID=79813 RepID=A0AAN7C3T8_9PEZI|nr:hypothetical protein C8A03DRAFT_47013 [Achaetomium macrosporum]
MASTERKGETNPVTGDAGPGTGLTDILPIPATNPNELTHAEQEQESSLSHALATSDHKIKGRTQVNHVEETKDLGWNQRKEDIAAPLVGGMDNEELWMLIRRFDKQMYHVKATPYPVPGGLDLNIADEEEFSPDKMRANVERLYMTVGVGILGAVKHIARLRSWRERRRTSRFAAAYFVAWLCDFIVPLLLGVLVTLIVYPRSREILFPPAPVALVDSKTGGVQKPKSGVLGSHDSATGSPENHKGEAVEQEAANFVHGIASVAVSSAAGKHPQGDPDSENEEGIEGAPDPAAVGMGAAEAKGKAGGAKTGAEHDKTKVPMETAMWTKMRPIMHTIGGLTDTWERIANALSPTPPFPHDTHRLRLAALIMPLLGLSFFVTSYMVMKGLTFGIGFVFFGDPVISRAYAWLNRTIPSWTKLLEMRNTILKGVPTNAQLTLTLLRIGEAHRAPLPPPPRISSPPPSQPATLTDANLRATGGDTPLNATPADLNAAITHDPAATHKTGGPDIDAAMPATDTDSHNPDNKDNKKKNKKGGPAKKALGIFRSAARAGVRTAIGTDTVRAKAGVSAAARDRLGAVTVPPARDTVEGGGGPVAFEARFEGRKGCVFLETGATVPVVGFSTTGRGSTTGCGGGSLGERKVPVPVPVRPVWSVPVEEIVEVRKIGGYGWKAKLVVGWSLEREVKDGLEITTAEGAKFKITAVPLRDELFNRLIAMGSQKWEAW